MLILAAGDARIDNHKFKEKFHFKAKMLSADEVLELVGHPVGGVCPFGIKPGIPVYLDISLKRFQTVFPAVGSGSSAIELNLDELFRYSNALEWIDVCKLPEEYKVFIFNNTEKSEGRTPFAFLFSFCGLLASFSAI